MRAAPPAGCPLASQGFWRWMHSTVPSIALGTVAWVSAPWPLGSVLCAVLTIAGLADWLWRRRAPMVLRWDGAQWGLGDRQGGQAALLWDGGRWLMARWWDAGTGARRWLLLDRADAVSAAEWHALRVALVQQGDGWVHRHVAAPRAEVP